MALSAAERHLLRGLRGPLARLRGRAARWAGLTLFPVHPAVERYLESSSVPPPDPVRAEMEALADREGFPIVGPLVGRFLEIQARAIGARRVFEFGSGFGYSAWWFARGMGPEGRLIATDADPENQRRALDFLLRAGIAERVDFQLGRAQERFQASDGLFDLCYNDVDKGDYPEVWRLARERLCPGGLYIADNTLWFGRVVRGERSADAWTRAIREHNRLIFEDREFDAFLYPVRDGVMVARRL